MNIIIGLKHFNFVNIGKLNGQYDQNYTFTKLRMLDGINLILKESENS